MVFKSYFDYCVQVWGSLGKTLSNKLQRWQNRAIRIISLQGYNVRSDEILKSFGFLNLQQQRILQLLILILISTKNWHLSIWLKFLLISIKYMIMILVNRSVTLHCQSLTLILWKKTFGYRGSLVWNNLSVDVKSSETLNIFKNKIKKLDI